MRALPESPISAPFDAIADVYDDTFSNSGVGRAQRSLVWKEMDRVFQPGQRILEINCGTGLDALHLAQRGVTVLATDSAPGMIAVARRRLASAPLRVPVDVRCVPIEQLSELEADGPFDGVLSNFSGLNCVQDLVFVARNLATLVRPGGAVVVCVFGRCCLWEIGWYLFQRDVYRAFRRFRKDGVPATLGGSTITVHYPSVGTLRRAFSPFFKCEHRTAVGVTIPPSYAGALAARFPWLFGITARLDPLFAATPGLRALADHAVLTFRRTAQ
jgi:ubiquinone/menaquinone biosynthesis C-methylase UbiE